MATNNKVVGHVYVLNNSAPTNSVSVFERYANGTLTFVNMTQIGGQGSGSFLDSQGSLIREPHRGWLFAVDAASHEISVIAVKPDGDLTPLSVSPSGGIQPISLTYSNGRLYVLNMGDSNHAANVSGFQVHHDGILSQIAGSTQPLSAATPNPAQVLAAPDGRTLLVTERMTNTIDSYSIHYNGSLSAPTSTPSTGETPFGMAFSPQDPSLFVVCDAGTGALTSYTLRNSHVLVKDGPVANQQIAPCWVVITTNGRFAYTGNTGSNTISAYQVGEEGKLTLLTSVPSNATSGAATEVVLTHDSRYLYVLDAFIAPGPGTAGLSAFQVQPDGRLVAVSELASITLPSSSSGLAVG